MLCMETLTHTTLVNDTQAWPNQLAEIMSLVYLTLVYPDMALIKLILDQKSKSQKSKCYNDICRNGL